MAGTHGAPAEPGGLLQQASVLHDDGSFGGRAVEGFLGGLVTDDRQTGNSRVPGLGNIPLIGNAFRSRNESQTRRTRAHNGDGLDVLDRQVIQPDINDCGYSG